MQPKKEPVKKPQPVSKPKVERDAQPSPYKKNDQQALKKQLTMIRGPLSSPKKDK